MAQRTRPGDRTIIVRVTTRFFRLAFLITGIVGVAGCHRAPDEGAPPQQIGAPGSAVSQARLTFSDLPVPPKPEVTAAFIDHGKNVYAQNCAACHRVDGGGQIGPNLTDDYWLHGAALEDIHKTVADGVLEKGMPPWSKVLKPAQLDAVVAYVATLKGTSPPNAKEPQGNRVVQ